MRRYTNRCSVCGRRIKRGRDIDDLEARYCSSRCASYGFQRHLILRQYADEVYPQRQPWTEEEWNEQQEKRFGAKWNEKLDSHKTDVELATELKAFLTDVCPSEWNVSTFDTSLGNIRTTFMVTDLNLAFEIYATDEDSLGSDYEYLMSRIAYFARHDCFLVQIFEPQWVLHRQSTEGLIKSMLGFKFNKDGSAVYVAEP